MFKLGERTFFDKIIGRFFICDADELADEVVRINKDLADRSMSINEIEERLFNTDIQPMAGKLIGLAQDSRLTVKGTVMNGEDVFVIDYEISK